MTDRHDVFLSYSRNDREAAVELRTQLGRLGLSVFHDQDSIREGELWLNRLQEAVAACDRFVVLVGRDGIRRWIAAETQVALSRYFNPHVDAERLPIFPILLGEVSANTLPPFLGLFQTTTWNGTEPLPERLLTQIRDRTVAANQEVKIDGCPFVGLNAYRSDQGNLFFGRQRETLDALGCFDTRSGTPTVRWLEINGNSGAGKSSLMNAGLLPLVDQGWLWPRTGYQRWRRIGPLMPGQHPIAMLAEGLAKAFEKEMADIRQRLAAEDDHALADWLRSRKEDDTAFLLGIDQFEELFTFADPGERSRFDRLLAAALEDSECPLFVISTVRADFLDRFDDLPRLLAVRNRLGKPWSLPPIGGDGLREVIAGPARLADLDVSEVQEAMVAEARDEPGALPLVENALHWLWGKREDRRLSGRQFSDNGGLAGILSQSADALLDSLGKRRGQALELLFRLVNVDPEGRRHTRRAIPLEEALDVAGDEDSDAKVVNRLAGERARDGGKGHGPLRLITVTKEMTGADSGVGDSQWVNLIHETLIRSKGLSEAGQPQPFWPTLWNYIVQHKERAARRERLRLQAREWKDRAGLRRVLGLAGWLECLRFRGLAAPKSIEQRYFRWSAMRALSEMAIVLSCVAVAGESLYWAKSNDLPLESIPARWAYGFGGELPLPELVKILPDEGSTLIGARTPGSDDTLPIGQSTAVEPFYIGATEVTFDKYDAYTEAVGRASASDHLGWGRGTRPVINVDWVDAKAYANWLGAMTGVACRLPSEAEWEYAARAGTTTEYALPAPAGSDDIFGKNLANCSECGSKWDGNRTAPVKSFPANGWGLYDMHGNVMEWVEDCDDSPAGDNEQCSTGVLRGGSWGDSRGGARSAYRGRLSPIDRSSSIGDRVLCSSPIVDH